MGRPRRHNIKKGTPYQGGRREGQPAKAIRKAEVRLAVRERKFKETMKPPEPRHKHHRPGSRKK